MDPSKWSNSTSNHFNCREGGSWWVCPEKPHFVGCCSVDPCTNVDENSTSPCPANKLSRATFDPSLYPKFKPNTCIGGTLNTNNSWHTCSLTNPPFIGCCSHDACADPSNEGCPKEDLIAAAWTTGQTGQFALLKDDGTDDKSSDGEDELSGGAIAGIVVGAVAALVIIGALIWFFIRRRKKKAIAMSRHGHPSVVEGQNHMYSSPASPYQGMYQSSPGVDPVKSLADIYCVCSDSQFSSPAGTTIGAGHDPKHTSTSSAGISMSSFSPGMPSERGRPISELYSNNTGSENISQQKHTSGQGYGLGLHGAKKPEPIHELENNAAEVHELDGLGSNRW